MAFSIDDAWDNCTPVARCGNAAFGAYCRLGAWSARNSTDGFVPAEVALGIASPELAQKLVDAGLWEAVEGGWSMPHYLERNESAAQVSARRQREADRKARWRKAQQAKSHGTRRGQDAEVPRDTTRTGELPFPPPKGGKGRAPSNAPPPALTTPRCTGFTDDGNGWCASCHLPKANKIHFRRAS